MPTRSSRREPMTADPLTPALSPARFARGGEGGIERDPDPDRDPDRDADRDSPREGKAGPGSGPPGLSSRATR